MITTNIYSRVFRTHFGGDVGTCFAIEIDGKQYIVTAKHLLPSRDPPTIINIDYGGVFLKGPCKLVGYGKDNTDIAVFAVPKQIAPVLPAPASRNDLAYGQDVYFLGFPYNLRIDLGMSQSKFPIPLVKKAILSGMEPGKYGTLYLDGINNPGFSGGPIVFAPHGKPRDFCIAGVVSGFRTEDIKALKGDDEDETDLIIRLNTGIIIGCSIEAATDVIIDNPIGHPASS